MKAISGRATKSLNIGSSVDACDNSGARICRIVSVKHGKTSKGRQGYAKIGDTKYAYTGYSGSTLTGVTPDPTGETGGFYIPLLDVLADTITELSDNIIQSGDISVITSVRKYGFKPYDVLTTFGSTGLTFSPILATDPQAT